MKAAPRAPFLAPRMTVPLRQLLSLGLSLSRGLAVACFLGLVALTAARAEEGKRTFDIPPGSAEDTLGLFAKQAATQFVFSAGKVHGVQTHGVKGGYFPREALTRLVAGTELRVVQDAGTGALTVDRDGSEAISEQPDVAKKKIP
jgi:hypothetical protein